MSPADAPQNPPLTRRRLREMRTQGIPIILPGTAEAAAAEAAARAAASAPAPKPAVAPEEPAVEAVVEDEASHDDVVQKSDAAAEEIVDAVVVDDADEANTDAAAGDDAESSEASEGEDDEAPRVIASDFGAELLAGDAATAPAPPSFDHLLTRSGPTSGSAAAPNALILSQTPDAGPLVVPVQASGEVIITGSYNLPESFAATGSVPGAADDKDTDAALLDEELPLASSPIPVSASAAISTIKTGEEIVAPPVPEKTNRIMMILAITAGVLALGLTGVLILSFATGVFR